MFKGVLNLFNNLFIRIGPNPLIILKANQYLLNLILPHFFNIYNIFNNKFGIYNKHFFGDETNFFKYDFEFLY